MLRRSAMVAALVGAVLALSAQVASAEWYDNGNKLNAGQNPEVHMKGTLGFTSPNGGVHCESGTIKTKLTGGTTEGDVTVFGAETPAGCEISGGLVFICGGTTMIKSITPTGQFKSSNNGGTTVTLTAITLHYECNNGFKLTATSIAAEPISGVPDKPKAMTKVAFAGSLNSNIGKLTFTANMNMVGTDSGTYGLVA